MYARTPGPRPRHTVEVGLGRPAEGLWSASTPLIVTTETIVQGPPAVPFYGETPVTGRQRDVVGEGRGAEASPPDTVGRVETEGPSTQPEEGVDILPGCGRDGRWTREPS